MRTEADQFAKEYEGFVRSIALRARAELDLVCDMDDLVAFGFGGLLEARGRFDASRGVQFNTFAYYRVRGAILDGVRKMAYLPPSAHRLRKAAEAMDWAAEEAGEARAANPAAKTEPDAAAAALDEMLGKLTASFVIAAVGQDESAQGANALERLVAAEDATLVRGFLAELPDRERLVLRAMYFDGRTLDDIGAELGLSKSWVSRIHTRAIGLLRARFAESG